MQSTEHKHIEQLLERFFEGQTSNVEEQELYTFFARPDLPESLAAYKPVFGYFETGIAEEFHTVEAISPAKKSYLLQKKWLLAGICAAASILLFVLNTVLFPQSFDPHEGSYIIRSGVRITDPETIRPELEAAIYQAEQQQSLSKQLACLAGEQDRRQEEIEDQLSARYNSILQSFPDKKVQKEVKHILGMH